METKEINALPEKVRKYIHDLETRADLAGDVQRMACLEDQIKELNFRHDLLFSALGMVKTKMKQGDVFDLDELEFVLRNFNLEI